MSLNLITDPWLPVITANGARRVVAPWQMADPSLDRFAWPRADLNVACIELLIGLLLLADPPEDVADWDERREPDPDRLRDRLAPFAPAFELLGDGPRFMQDREELVASINSPDMLFIDSGSHLISWGTRYPILTPPLAAVALYALQSFSPAGGRGNRTSMRGGGPMVTLVQPARRPGRGGLWDMIWANTPCGRPATPEALPWMRATRTSEKGQQVLPADAHPVEAFFGMPRRLRLVEADGLITGVIQRPYGANYAGWDHPLTPYYRPKLADDWLPRHPRAGLFGYRNWLGVVVAGQQAADSEAGGLTRRAQTLRDWHERGGGRGAQILVAGWAMDNMKPRDFTLSIQPCVDLPRDRQAMQQGMIEAAEQYGVALRAALKPVLAEGEGREALREAFFAETTAPFMAGLSNLSDGTETEAVARDWLKAMRQVAMALFEARALPGLADREVRAQQDIVNAHRNLGANFAGYGKLGSAAYNALGLPLPARKKKEPA